MAFAELPTPRHAPSLVLRLRLNCRIFRARRSVFGVFRLISPHSIGTGLPCEWAAQMPLSPDAGPCPDSAFSISTLETQIWYIDAWSFAIASFNRNDGFSSTTRALGATLSVSQTFDPMTAPEPMTVLPPRIVALA